MTGMAAKWALDELIKKARIHLYKPIQIAEILYRDRVFGDLDLGDLSTYRTYSRRWRDSVCMQLLGRTSTSSSRYQEDLFNDNAIPPDVLVVLGQENRKGNGTVEAYIYKRFQSRYAQITSALNYCADNDKTTFQLDKFIELFHVKPGLRRSIDKVFEIIVYALFETLVEHMNITVTVKLDQEQLPILLEFEKFAKAVLGLDANNPTLEMPARFHRVGVTNAADRGLDMWANYGPAVQIKHLTLSEDMAEDIVSELTADRIIIVCKDSESQVILSLLSQIGWRSRIQSVITQSDLECWYEKALRGPFGQALGDTLLQHLSSQIRVEFPPRDSVLDEFMDERGYLKLVDEIWCVLDDAM